MEAVTTYLSISYSALPLLPLIIIFALSYYFLLLRNIPLIRANCKDPAEIKFKSPVTGLINSIKLDEFVKDACPSLAKPFVAYPVLFTGTSS